MPMLRPMHGATAHAPRTYGGFPGSPALRKEFVDGPSGRRPPAPAGEGEKDIRTFRRPRSHSPSVRLPVYQGRGAIERRGPSWMHRARSLRVPGWWRINVMR